MRDPDSRGCDGAAKPFPYPLHQRAGRSRFRAGGADSMLMPRMTTSLPPPIAARRAESIPGQRNRIRALLSSGPRLRRVLRAQDEFSPFRVLRIPDYEIRHSNVLAWLLTPDETHRLGVRFLRDILKSVEPSWPPLRARDCDSIVVEREADRTDILVQGLPENRILLVENKVWAGEGHRQLSRYA